MRNQRGSRALLALAAALSTALAAQSCGEPTAPRAVSQPNADLVDPLTGHLKVVTSTTGSDLDPNGYTVTLDLLTSKQVATNGNVTFKDVLTGPHVVELSGVASNCTVTSSNPQTATVLAGSTTEVNFTISCKATTGSIKVITQTTGSELDPDGYTVTVNTETQSKSIGINDAVTFTGLSSGDHTVTLSGVAANCTVSTAEGPNPRTVTVTAGQTTSTTFSVSCAPTTGTLSVTTATTGDGIPTSYTLDIAGPQTASVTIGPNETQTFSGVPSGDYSLTLTVPSNCTVSDANPRTVTVPAGSTGSTTFSVSCTATTTGTLSITTSTTGEGIPTSFTLNVTGPSFPTGTSASIGPNATVTATVDAGDYTVELVVPSNCVVSTAEGPNPRIVTVPASSTGSTTFSVSCTATTTTGTLAITTSTTGEGIPTSYTVSATGPSFPTGASTTIGPNATVTATVEAGDYTVTLSDVPANCTVSGDNPRVVPVPAGGTGSTTFSVSCTAATSATSTGGTRWVASSSFALTRTNRLTM